MSTRRAGTAVAAVALTAAAVLTAGCGGGGGGGERGGDRGASGTPHAQEQRQEGDGGSPARKEAGTGKPTATPKVPEAELTPATGSFTKKERTYLVGRVPRGLEPAAVLEAGRAACARIGTAAGVSEKDVVSALRAGEIDNAEPAVTHLCPRYKPLLKKARNGDRG